MKRALRVGVLREFPEDAVVPEYPVPDEFPEFPGVMDEASNARRVFVFT
jgi:hypothetical protein